LDLNIAYRPYEVRGPFSIAPFALKVGELTLLRDFLSQPLCSHWTISQWHCWKLHHIYTCLY